jgi:hypothetical protein
VKVTATKKRTAYLGQQEEVYIFAVTKKLQRLVKVIGVRKRVQEHNAQLLDCT